LPRLLSQLVSVEEAVRKALERVSIKLGVEEVSVWNALGRVLAEDVVAPVSQPPFHRSAVDGYAVRSQDTYGASPLNPAVLRVKGFMHTGDTPDKYALQPGEAVEVSTGAPLPVWADAVVMYEDAKRVGDVVEVYRAVAAFENVSRMGEDYRAGEVVVPAGRVLKPWDLAMIASCGLSRVRVYEKVRVGVVCTGSEVVEPGFPVKPGEVYNSTCVLAVNYLKQLGFVEPRYYGVFGDDPSVIRDVVLNALSENHVLVTCGGAGVSDQDAVVEAVRSLGEFVFRGVAIRPGRPTSLALVGGKPVFTLSGYPVAVWTALEAVVAPVLYLVLGLEEPAKPTVKARLNRSVPNVIGYRSYIRVRVWREGSEYVAEPFMLRGSGVLSSLVKSSGYIVVPENSEGFQEGDIVEVVLL